MTHNAHYTAFNSVLHFFCFVFARSKPRLGQLCWENSDRRSAKTGDSKWLMNIIIRMATQNDHVVTRQRHNGNRSTRWRRFTRGHTYKWVEWV